MKRPASGFNLDARLQELAREYGVPGAAAAICHRGNLMQAAFGVASLRTGVPVTTDTLFQIGSITKVYTATLIMQLVDSGQLSLDAPIGDFLPELQVGEGPTAGTITIRHLLTHTAGLEGDVFLDCGRGDDAVGRYVHALRDMPSLHAPGEILSYCNSGFVLLGRVVERLVGVPYYKAIQEKLAVPAGLTETLLLPEEVILRKFAVGHLPTGPDGQQQVAPVWALPGAMAPAGSLTCSTAADVVRFAQMHLRGGMAESGRQVLSADSALAMRTAQARCQDPYTLGENCGLGWFLELWDGTVVVGHDGGTIGQSAVLRMLPEEDLIVVLLSNGGEAQAFLRQLTDEIFLASAGVRSPAVPEPLEHPGSEVVDAYVGRYERAHLTLEFRVREGRLLVDTTPDGPLAEWAEPKRDQALKPCGNGVFLTEREGRNPPVIFHGFDAANQPAWVFVGGRAHRRRD